MPPSLQSAEGRRLFFHRSHSGWLYAIMPPMKHYTHLLSLALAAAIIPTATAAQSGFRTKAVTTVLPSLETVFGPSPDKILEAIAKAAGDNSHTNYALPMADIRHIDGPSPFVKTVGDPMPKEEWKSTAWFVEGDWIPPIEVPNANTLCTACLSHLTWPHTTICLYTWERVDSDKGALCKADNLRFAFKPQRFAKVRIQTRTYTYAKKSNPSDATKVARTSVECLAIVPTLDEMKSRGFWEEERQRRERFNKWLKEMEASAPHPKEKPKSDSSSKVIPAPPVNRQPLSGHTKKKLNFLAFPPCNPKGGLLYYQPSKTNKDNKGQDNGQHLQEVQTPQDPACCRSHAERNQPRRVPSPRTGNPQGEHRRGRFGYPLDSACLFPHQAMVRL